jgi:transglutaminase-like putative cysteine protease
MKYKALFFLLFGAGLFFCHSNRNPENGFSLILEEFRFGNFQKVSHLSDSLKNVFPGDTILTWKLDSMTDMCHRISVDFSLTGEEIKTRLNKVMGNFTPEQKTQWEKEDLLEYRVINGEKRYFNRAATNLRLLLAHRGKMQNPSSPVYPDATDSLRIELAQKAFSGKTSGKPVNPVNIRIKYSLTVDAGAVPAGETVRCWLPYPKESHARQQNVVLIRTSPSDFFLAPDTAGQRSLYLEQKSAGNQPTVFEMELTYKPFAQYFNPDSLAIKPYDNGSPLFIKYTAEDKPHIVFSEKIRKLADDIVGKETDPLKKVKKIYYWINENIPWAGALEYSTMPNIPEYVLNNKHGDCGMQTLLFMTLARYSGIPVKWQSGWMMPPGDVNLHDWCEVWYEGIGWVPLDMSFGLLPSEDRPIREYYISGIDAYRFIVNDATGTPFIPAKKFIRSEPVDFQRGEVEWKGANLYFDKWHYHMEVSYF